MKRMKHNKKRNTLFLFEILIREMTGYNTQHITKVINVMKKKYVGLHQEYYSKGEVTI